MAILLVGLYLIALGNGGIKPNVSSLGADQFDQQDPAESQHMSHFFNWFYFIISVGSLISVTVFVYLQDNVGFGVGFGLPAGVMVVGILVFVAGAPLYRYRLPGGSPLTRIAQVVVAAVRKSNLPVPSDDRLLYVDDGKEHGPDYVQIRHTKQFK